MATDITPAGSACPIFLEPPDPKQVAADKTANDKRDTALDALAAAKKSAYKKLAALGLTPAEIAAL